MKQGTLTAVAATMMQEFARTVEAAEKETAAAIADNTAAIRLAMNLRAESEELIQAKQREAAQLISDSIALKEEADADFKMAMAAILKQADGMAGDKIADAGKLKLISSKKAA
jgi:hypothetical protein